MPTYFNKVVQSGDMIETYSYERPVKYGEGGFGGGGGYSIISRKPLYDFSEVGQAVSHFLFEFHRAVTCKEGEDYKIKRTDNLLRTKRNIRRIVSANPDMRLFCTLTFAENIQDLRLASQYWHSLVVRLKKYASTHKISLKYLCIVEFQKRGAVHYHFLCNIPYIENATLASMWKYGFVKVRKLKDYGIHIYLMKYISKECEDMRLFGWNKYHCSQNVSRPKVYRFDSDTEFWIYLFFVFNVKDTGKVFEREYFSDYLGCRIQYVLYNSSKDSTSEIQKKDG